MTATALDNTVVFDHAFDTSDSSVIHSAYFDEVNQYLYLTFNNGTQVSRDLSDDPWTVEDFEDIDSWGYEWNYTFKDAEKGPEIPANATFVQRTVASAAFIDADDLDEPDFDDVELGEDVDDAQPGAGLFVTLAVQVDSWEQANKISTLLHATAEFLRENANVTYVAVTSTDTGGAL